MILYILNANALYIFLFYVVKICFIPLHNILQYMFANYIIFNKKNISSLGTLIKYS